MIFNSMIIVFFVLGWISSLHAVDGVRRACPTTISPIILARIIEGRDLSSGERSSVSASGVTYELKASEWRLKMLRASLSKAFKLGIDKMYYSEVELGDHAMVRKHGNQKFELAPNVSVVLSKLLGKTNHSLLCGYIIKRDGRFLYQDRAQEVAIKITFAP